MPLGGCRASIDACVDQGCGQHDCLTAYEGCVDESEVQREEGANTSVVSIGNEPSGEDSRHVASNPTGHAMTVSSKLCIGDSGESLWANVGRTSPFMD